MKSKSKFEWMPYIDGGYTCIAFNAAKYTKDEAIAIASAELDCQEDRINVKRAWAYYGFGVDDNGETRNCYWISSEKCKSSFEVILCEET